MLINQWSAMAWQRPEPTAAVDPDWSSMSEFGGWRQLLMADGG